MVVDEDDAIRGSIAIALKDHVKVIEAMNGNAAIALAEVYNPDLIILDLMLPQRSIEMTPFAHWREICLRALGFAIRATELAAAMRNLNGDMLLIRLKLD